MTCNLRHPMSLRHPVSLCSFQISMFLSKWCYAPCVTPCLYLRFVWGGWGRVVGCPLPHCLCVCERKREKECVCICVSWWVLSLTVSQCVSVREQKRERVCVFEFRACASSDWNTQNRKRGVPLSTYRRKRKKTWMNNSATTDLSRFFLRAKHVFFGSAIAQWFSCRKYPKSAQTYIWVSSTFWNLEHVAKSLGKIISSARRLPYAALRLLERWPQVCRVNLKITFTVLMTNRFVSTTFFFMKCVVNWIPLRICVRSRNTQPNLNARPKRISEVQYIMRIPK